MIYQNCFKNNITSINIQNNILKCGKHEEKLPTYMSIEARIQHLKQVRKKLGLEYYRVFNDVINGHKVNDKDFNKVVDDVKALENEIEKLMGAKQDKESRSRLEGLRDRFLALQDSNRNLLQSKSKFDPMLYTELIKNHKSQRDIWRDMSAVQEIPKEFIQSQTSSVPSPQPSPPPVEKKKKTTKKRDDKHTKPVILTNIQKNQIKENVKELLKKTYKFKDKEQCSSKQRSKEYYMTKDDILKEIESNNKLKNLMPTNYKSLTKEKLCEVLFHLD